MPYKNRFLPLLLSVSVIAFSTNVAFSASFDDEFNVQKASAILPADVLQTEAYRVSETVSNDGKNDVFVIDSKYGAYIAEGRYELSMKLAEIRAIAELDEVEKGKEFANALIKAGKAPFEAAWSLVTAPVDTVGGAVKGVGRTIQRWTGLVTQDRSELEDARYKELLGVSALKRKYAYELGVDVYSSNKQLQEKLNNVAWVSFSGHLSTKVLMTLPENNKVRKPLLVGSTTKSLNETIRDKTPEDLHSSNKEKLTAMRVGEILVETFLSHDWFSPRHQTAIVMALESMAKVDNKNLFLAKAISAQNEQDAMYYQHIAQMMADYSKSNSELVKFYDLGRVVAAKDMAGNVALFIPYDHVFYNAKAQGSVKHIENVLNSFVEDSQKKAVFLGRVSRSMRAALEERSWSVSELETFKF